MIATGPARQGWQKSALHPFWQAELAQAWPKIAPQMFTTFPERDHIRAENALQVVCVTAAAQPSALQLVITAPQAPRRTRKLLDELEK